MYFLNSLDLTIVYNINHICKIQTLTKYSHAYITFLSIFHNLKKNLMIHNTVKMESQYKIFFTINNYVLNQ